MKSNNNKLLKTATEKPAVPLTTVTGFMKNVNNITSEDQVTTINSLSGVQEFPMRIKCATMAWHTVLSALNEKNAQNG